MIFSCTQENFKHAMSLINFTPTQNLSLPILLNTLIEARNGIIQLTATNLELGVISVLRGKIEEEGSFTASTKLLTDYITYLPHDRVDVTTTEKNLEVKGKNQHARIPGIPGEEFPLIPTVKSQKKFTIEREALHNTLEQVLFATSSRTLKPETSGVYFQFIEKTLTCAATDSYRLAEKKIPFQTNKRENSSVIVPYHSLEVLTRILAQLTEKELTVDIGEGQILFHNEVFSLFSRLLDGEYPHYEQFIPQQPPTTVTMRTSELVNAVRAASLFAQHGVFDITLTTHPTTQRLTVSAQSAQKGSQESELPCEAKGPGVRITFNHKYLLDGLSHMAGDEVSLKLTSTNDPALLVPTAPHTYRYLLMPIRQ